MPLKREIDAAAVAAGLNPATAKEAWLAVKAARTGAKSPARDASEVAAAISAVSTTEPDKAAAFKDSLAAASSVASSAPSLTPAPAEHADAVEQALIAAGVPEPGHAKRTGAFADALAKGHNVDEALTRLLGGLSDEATTKGKARFAELSSNKRKFKIPDIVGSRAGWVQLVTLVVAGLALWNVSLQHKGWFVIAFIGLVFANLMTSDRKILTVINVAFVILVILAATFGVSQGGGQWEFK